MARYVSGAAGYQTRYPVRVAIDARTICQTGAVFFQVRPHCFGWSQVTMFGDYYGFDVVSADNARAIDARCKELS